LRGAASLVDISRQKFEMRPDWGAKNFPSNYLCPLVNCFAAATLRKLRGLARYCRFPQFSSTAANRGGASPFARFRLQELQTLCESCTFG